KDGFVEAIPFYQRAIRLDPNFAMAYAVLGAVYAILGETAPEAENIRRAYDLRARVSEPERFYIESTYYHFLNGDLEKRAKYMKCGRRHIRETFCHRSACAVSIGNLGSTIKLLRKYAKRSHWTPQEPWPTTTTSFRTTSI